MLKSMNQFSLSMAHYLILQSDLVDWPGSTRNRLPPLIDAAVPHSEDLLTRFNGYRSLFCPNLNCVQANCPTHGMRSVWTLYKISDAAISGEF